MAMHGKNVALTQSQRKIEDLRERNHKLELEIARLKGENYEPEDTQTIDEKRVVRPKVSLADRFRQSFNPRYR
jgi:cell division protein FtsB